MCVPEMFRPGAASLLVWMAAPANAASGGLEIFPASREDLLILLGLIAFFLILIRPANRLLFAPLLDMLDARDRMIAGEREKAQDLTSRGDLLKERYEDAVGAARDQADALREEVLGAARAEQGALLEAARGDTEQEITRSRAQLADSVQRAGAELQGESEHLAREIAAQVLGRPLS